MPLIPYTFITQLHLKFQYILFKRRRDGFAAGLMLFYDCLADVDINWTLTTYVSSYMYFDLLVKIMASNLQGLLTT